jgi:hypothetical protein
MSVTCDMLLSADVEDASATMARSAGVEVDVGDRALLLKVRVTPSHINASLRQAELHDKCNEVGIPFAAISSVTKTEKGENIDKALRKFAESILSAVRAKFKDEGHHVAAGCSRHRLWHPDGERCRSVVAPKPLATKKGSSLNSGRTSNKKNAKNVGVNQK